MYIAVQPTGKLIAKGIDAVGREELIQILLN